MRKKFIYIGLLLLAIAVVAFFVFVIASPFSSAISKIVTTYNVSVSSDGFYYVPVSVSNSIRSIIYVALNGSTNVYLFNASTFHTWSSKIQSNSTASGLAEARLLGTGIGSLIEHDVNVSQILLTDNLSTSNITETTTGFSGFNGTAYVVIDNTRGSRSNSTAVKGAVLYFGLTPSNLGLYQGVGFEVLGAGIFEIALIIAGLVLIIYGALKKDPNIETGAMGAAGKANDAAKGGPSKEYIDSLYKGVDKKKKDKKKDKDAES